ncbi:CHAT domain-containing protein [Streptomyces bicolor]|uniref:CHAT domain-containing protein n=1 Tax=Streptomyces bicolor TaxID=66874 RepID=UPI0004E18369|nr:CHAT domain-containing protein [Streptomyces bicolor]
MTDLNPTAEEVRARRDELLDTLADTASDDPDAPALCGLVGELSYRLLVMEGGEEDLRLAAEAFALAFRTPGDDGDWAAWRIFYGHVRAFQYDADPSPELREQMWELLRDGVSGLDDGDDYHDLVRDLARQLLAACAKQRYMGCEGPAQRRLELLDEALRLHEDAAGTLEPGSEEAVDLMVSRGYLHLERVELRSDPADAEAAARHYGAALDAGLPGADVPLLRHSLGLALMAHGRMTQDREELERAREEFGAALLEVRRTTGTPPSWAWEAEIRAVFVRATIWAHWKDHAQAAAAEVELAGLLADPADVDRLLPLYLDTFGRLLFERGGVRGDGAAQDRAIALIRKAVDEWVPERDGPVTTTALFLGVFQQSRYRDDPDPGRLHDVAEAAGLVLADEAFDDGMRQLARMMGAWAWIILEDTHGIAPEAGAGVPAGMSTDDAREAYLAMLRDLESGRGFLDFSDTSEDFPGIFKSFGGVGRLGEGFDHGYARFRELEPGRDRAWFAVALLSHSMLLDPHGTHIPAEQKEELIDCALSYGEDDPVWQRRAHAVVATVRLREELAGTGRGMDEVLDHLARAEEAADPNGGDQRLGHGIDLARIAATHHRGQTAGAGDDIEAAAAMWGKLRDNPALTPHLRKVMAAQQSAFDAVAAAQRGDLAATDRHLADLQAAHATLDPDDHSRVELWTHLENARSARDRLARTLGAPPAPPLVGRPSLFELRRAAKQLPRDHRAWVLGDNGITRCVRASEARDPQMLAEAMELLQEAYDLVDEGSDSKLRYAHCLGSSHCALAEMQRLPAARTRHLTRGIALLETAFDLAGGPEHRLYAGAGLALGRAYRTRGELSRDDRAAGRRTGLDALRGHAWAALLQSGTEHAAQAVREATDTAFEVAGWCLRDGTAEEAVRALDACRGLVLHAATTSRTVPERLVAAGRDDLAEEWHAAGLGSEPADPLAAMRAPQSVPSSLRRRVLAALTGTDSVQDRLLDPPSPDEIGTALRTLRKDALVYLVPVTDDTPGTAVVVTSTGAVHSVPLPTLRADAAPLREYAAAAGGAAGRDMGPVPGYTSAAAAGPSLRQRLDRLCGWAWYAGMRPLLDMFATRTGRVPRLVFIPMDTLSLVPWHAAWGGPDDGRRYALHEAEISYAASARLLCDVAARPAVDHSGAALVVGNPTGDLRYAGEEADAVQRVFYPRGRFLGRRETGEADGTGTPGEVLQWLTHGGPGAEGGPGEGVEEGAVLHLACHAAIARDARRTAHLSLHGGELAAEELTEAVGGAGRGRLGLVLLAACRSHVSGRGYNEAYSLATAFLVAGARSVVGSLWPVPDDATSVLMFLTHHYLRTEGEPPARALRRAQLWMLDPARELPADLPERLAERARCIDPDDLSSWAGFTHLGQ